MSLCKCFANAGSEPVGLEYAVVPGQAAFWYSLMRPSHRVDLSAVMVAGGAAGSR